MKTPFKRQKAAQKQPKARTSAETATVSTQAQLGAALHRSTPQISAWVNDPRWTFARRGPWNVAAVRAWAENTLEPHQGIKPLGDGTDEGGDGESEASILAGLSPERAAKLRLVIARARKVELDRAILTGVYQRRADVERANVARVHAVRGALLALPQQLAKVLVGRSEAQIETELVRAVTALCERFAGTGDTNE